MTIGSSAEKEDHEHQHFIPLESVGHTLFVPKCKWHCVVFSCYSQPPPHFCWAHFSWEQLMWGHLISPTGMWTMSSIRFVKVNFPCFPQFLQVFLSQGHSHPIKYPRLLSCHSCMQQLKLFLPWHSNGQFKALFQHALLPVWSVMVTKKTFLSLVASSSPEYESCKAGFMKQWKEVESQWSQWKGVCVGQQMLLGTRADGPNRQPQE